MEINRQQVIEGFLQNIYRISNKEYQERVWIKGLGPECHDFDEAVNEFSSDVDPILENPQDYGITNSQHEVLIKFQDEFKAFYYENDFPIEFIDTPEWAKIMDSAKEVLKAFNYK